MTIHDFMKDSIVEAIDELKMVFGNDNVILTPEKDGGAYVMVKKIELGAKFNCPHIWCSFYINYLYPASDIYPHYVSPELCFSNGEKLNGPFSTVIENKNKDKCIQVSRRSNRWNPAQDTALLKLEKVLKFIKEL